MPGAIEASYAALFPPNQVTELRILEIPGRNNFTYNAAGWFDNPSALAEAVATYEPKHPAGFFVTINNLHRACLARSPNRITERLKLVSSDRDIVSRRWLPIDLDPARPSGISATQEELEMARSLASDVVGHLQNELSFPPGLIAHSGNGIHILYRVELANDDYAKELTGNCLKALAKRFDTDAVHIDTGIGNASRILKLWGTVARKGEHMDDRPHRRSRLWTEREFKSIGIVQVEQLEKLIKSQKPTKQRARARVVKGAKPKTSGNETNFRFDLEAWIEANGITIVREEDFDGSGRRYYLDHCLFNESHTGTSAILGRSPSGAIFYKCQHESCARNTWAKVKQLFSERVKRERATARDSDPDATPWSLANDFVDQIFTTDDHGRITLRRHRETWYAYSSKTHGYESMSNDAMRMTLTRWLGEGGLDTKGRVVSDVTNSVASLVTVAETLDRPFLTMVDIDTKCATAKADHHNWITLKNGILDIDSAAAGLPLQKCLMEHTPEWFSSVALKFDFPMLESEAGCDRWLLFLDEILEGDQSRIGIVQEMFGYCLLQTARFERFFILHGRGRNGKSTVLDILADLLGEPNITNLSLDQMASPTLRYQLDGKLANICNDLPEIEKVAEGLLKRIASGEPVICDRKYKDAVRMRTAATLIFATNVLPRFTDSSLAPWRRMVLIPFRFTVHPDRVDTKLKDKLRKELPGIMVWALQGAARLQANGRFKEAGECETAKRFYRMSCFPVFTFLEECTRPEGSINTKDLWTKYKEWGKVCGFTKPAGLHVFTKAVLDFHPHVEHPRVTRGMLKDVSLTGISMVPGLNIEEAGEVPQGYEQRW